VFVTDVTRFLAIFYNTMALTFITTTLLQKNFMRRASEFDDMLRQDIKNYVTSPCQKAQLFVPKFALLFLPHNISWD